MQDADFPKDHNPEEPMRFLGLAALKTEGQATTFDRVGCTFIRRKDVPKRPKESKRILFDSSDRVYEHGRLRWRYRYWRLVRFIEYREDADTAVWPFLREWHKRSR